ncbi:hypothetical protein [Legionella sp. WA2024007413]
MNEKIENAPLKAKKKSVSWNDGQIEGKIGESFLKVDTSASPTKEVLEAEIAELMKKGFSEVEASSMVGKAQTPSGMVIITDPVFYDSKDQIAERKFSNKQSNPEHVNAAKTTSSASESSNRYSFFTPTVIGVGMAIAFAATIGFASNK